MMDQVIGSLVTTAQGTTTQLVLLAAAVPLIVGGFAFGAYFVTWLVER